MEDVRPQGLGCFSHFQIDCSILLVVSKEIAKQPRMNVVCEKNEKILVKFKGCGELDQNLSNKEQAVSKK